jgi:hypothetical protein
VRLLPILAVVWLLGTCQSAPPHAGRPGRLIHRRWTQGARSAWSPPPVFLDRLATSVAGVDRLVARLVEGQHVI